ncbi:ABC transporter permease [Thermoclostridium stercorarium subsp. thermolacticum DSM 2910]|uniref:ABC transporter permease n=2 Tax=Thermoclostridium stercorarium TaxID=1510 RepID=A0A1B1YIF4_THEST|nr:sugar ABC transporter permease [Thermoclostridium stercorarium]ANW97952.1 ABC transporter permease [Thermoclostridium stercorarium subsp. thermolacticum DSM 2910]ANX00502.1 ABC transporter permease [Thermoclostridium stercorarium subsp. leptospartum DSM 9219]UZQ86113.1 sugar ABC transporter permease [Thermoclostridium stercorarium]
MKRKKSYFHVWDNIWGYAFVLIPLIGLVVFVLIPLCMTVYASFTAWPLGQSITSAKWVGLDNYITMFNTPLFWKSLGNTFFYMIGIPIGLVLSLIYAALMNRGTRYEKVFRVIYYTPVITSTVAVSFIFQRMFMSDGGVINTYLSAIGIKNPPNWMSHPAYTKWVIIIMAVWKGLGNSIIMYIAGMQGISKTYYEAAKIDGAGWFYTFRKITVPLLMPVTFYLVVTGIIGGAQMYVEPRLVFAGNGPANSTFTTVIHLYDNTFRYSKAGYGSAVATVLGVIVFVITAFQFYMNGRRERNE